MTREQLFDQIRRVFQQCPGNVIAPEVALLPELAGKAIWEDPLICIASAADPLYAKLQEPDVIGPWHMLPHQWLPGAKAVVSIFFPFTETIKDGQRPCAEPTAPSWLHGRVEGQDYIAAFTKMLCESLREQGVACCAPCVDSRFHYIGGGATAFPGFPDAGKPLFTSNWSERHTAYIAGLGTFGLNKGLITEKGMAGRFTSVIVDLPLQPDERPYTGLYDYCIFCGACMRRCPVDAITEEEGKDHISCGKQIGKTRVLYAPRYGCGACQTAVPCENRNPSRKDT